MKKVITTMLFMAGLMTAFAQPKDVAFDKANFPNDKEGFLLIKVTPEWMEILSESRNIIGDPETRSTPFVRFD